MNTLLRIHSLTTRFDSAITSWGGSLWSLAIRGYVGWQFFKSGMVKVSDWDATLSLFRDEYSVPLLPPELAAIMGAGGELVFPVLLFVGLFSRPAALGLFGVNAMAVISYPLLRTLDCPAAINDHFYWAILLLAIAAFGAGKFSLDHWLTKRPYQPAIAE